MLCIDNKYTDAYFNMAAEEYLFKKFSTAVFMLWQNEPCVVIGRHQNIRLEVNMDLIQEKKIKVVRRYSGGGTVYQDLGNLNLTFIDVEGNHDFDRYTKQMQQILATIGIQAQSDERRGLYIDGYKISGSAQYIRGNKTLYHATLLFSSNLSNLTSALEPRSTILNNNEVLRPWRNVRSVKSPVTNIKDHLPVQLTMDEFKKLIIKQFVEVNIIDSVYQFTDDDVAAICSLMRRKYATPDWNLEAKFQN
jgi:Lipoate-protein ligase A